MQANSADRERQRIAHHVRASRLAQRLSIDEAAASVGMSPVTWTRVEQAKTVRSLTYAGIERALGWPSGTLESLASGGTPPATERPTQPPPDRPADAQADRAEDLIAEIYDSGMPDDVIRALVRAIRNAEAQRLAELRTAQDELERWRRRKGA